MGPAMSYLPPPPEDDSGFDFPRRAAWCDLLEALSIAGLASAIALVFIVVMAIMRGNPARSDDVGSPRDIYPAPAGNSHVLVASYGRPSNCPLVRWCGCYLEHYLRDRGYVMPRDHTLWRARNWEKMGQPAPGPAPGVIAIFARGRKGGGHVGIITRVIGPGRIVLKSGNDENAVRERERSTRGVTAYRRLAPG